MAWQVGDYTTEGEKPFDQGSFGTVWKARRLSDGVKIALKLVLLTDAADARDRIAAERHGAMLQQHFERAHGMVPRVYDYGYDADGNLFIAMELIAGGALSDIIKNGPLDPQVAAQYAVRICDFLDKAHSFATVVEGEPYDRVVHADLKPGHVLISDTGDIKILDFGIAKALAKTTQVTTNNWGTSAYASPERLDKGHVNEHVDFWSLGVMLYEMVSGHRPYPALDRNRSQLEHAIRTNAPREVLPASCPRDLTAIVNKLLAYQVERRYASAAAIKSDLELFLAGDKPSAMDQYATPATMPIAQATSRRPAAAVGQVVPPTDPLPIAAATGGAIVNGTPATAASQARRLFGFVSLRRVLAVVAGLWFIGVIASEGVAWVAAERLRHTLDNLEGSSVSATRDLYERIRGQSPLHMGLRARVDHLLERRLSTLADAVILDYRREEPTMTAADWKQAQDALRWAVQLTPRDTRLLAKLRTCEAHVIRIAARTQPVAIARQTYRRAVERFRSAAELDDNSYDPYLGISRIAVYGLGDVDQAAAAIEQAEKRGYVSGRRERALLGDGYLKRANNSRTLARTLSGEQRRRELEKARADYEGCIEAFDPIVGFGYAAKNLENCKRQLERLDRELETLDAEKPGL